MEHHNDVLLSGIVANEPQIRELGDGREVLQWRMKILRPDSGSDSIACSAEAKQVIKSVTAAGQGGEMEVAGSLRSRFWNSGAGMASRLEVDVTKAKRIR